MRLNRAQRTFTVLSMYNINISHICTGVLEDPAVPQTIYLIQTYLVEPERFCHNFAQLPASLLHGL